MKDGFIKVAAVTPEVKVADISYNCKKIIESMEEAHAMGARVVVFPELCITGYSCRDLFHQDLLLRRAVDGLLDLAQASASLSGIFFVGLPYLCMGKLYNVVAAISGGEVIGLVPKVHLPNYSEFYEARQFSAGFAEPRMVPLNANAMVPLGTNQLFACADLPELIIGAEICEDLWTPNPPSTAHAMAGATLIVNPSASDEVTGKSDYRAQLVAQQSARLYAGYIYASAGEGESTQDVVYSGHRIAAEGGSVLTQGNLFTPGITITEIDLKRLVARRRGMSTFDVAATDSYFIHSFSIPLETTSITRHIDPHPFVPQDANNLNQRCEEILNIQSMGLKKRLAHTNSNKAVIGISGGLDSTLALLVTVRAFELLNLDKKGIIAITMPGFGTTDRTYTNAVSMVNSVGATLREIPIAAAVRQHFADIGHPESVHDITYENCQARERTQILMDVANKENGLVIGTGDLSELALGWATYNGDHMSMYGVNCSVPKTLVRHLVSYYAANCAEPELSAVLRDVLDTPVSPELLPPDEGQISQKTEDLVGPYELHDFFLYHLMRMGEEPTKIYRLAQIAFEGSYDDATILKWLRTFYGRFFAQQFKRSCLPDGPKVGTVSLSPRGDWRMPSDAAVALWMEEINSI